MVADSSSTSRGGGYAPFEAPRVSVAGDGTLAAIHEASRVTILEIPSAMAFAEIGVDPDALASEVAWVGAAPRLIVLSRYAAHSTVHLLDPYGPRTIAEIRLEAPMQLFATVGAAALVVGSLGAAVLAATETHLTVYQFPARTLPFAAGAAAGQFVVALAGSIEEWDPQSRMPKRRLRLPRTAAITAVGGSERVVWMTTQQEPARIDVIPLVNRGQPRAHDFPEPIARVASHPRSDLVACIGADSGRLYVVDLDGRTRLRVIEPEGFDRIESAGLVVGRMLGVVAAQAGHPIAVVSLNSRELGGDPAPPAGVLLRSEPAKRSAPSHEPPERPARDDRDETRGADSTDALDTRLSETRGADSTDALDTRLSETRGADSADALDTRLSETHGADSTDALDTRLSEAHGADSADALDTRSPEAHGADATDALDARPPELPGATPVSLPSEQTVPVFARAAPEQTVPASARPAPGQPGPAWATPAPAKLAAPMPVTSLFRHPTPQPALARAGAPAPARPAPSAGERFSTWRDRVGQNQPREPIEPASTPAAPPATRSEAPQSWRDEVVAWSRAVTAGTVEHAAPAAPAIGAVLARFELELALHPVLVLLYGAHLCGERGAAPVDVARVLDRQWDEALGRGELARRGIAGYLGSRVALSPVILRVLDELPPLAGTLVGEPGTVALLGPCVVVAGDEPITAVAERCLSRVGGAILAAYGDPDRAELVFEARACGAAAMLRPAAGLEAAPSEPAIFVVDDAGLADRLGMPRLA